jgi:hypothetical protein
MTPFKWFFPVEQQFLTEETAQAKCAAFLILDPPQPTSRKNLIILDDVTATATAAAAASATFCHSASSANPSSTSHKRSFLLQCSCTSSLLLVQSRTEKRKESVQRGGNADRLTD